MYPHYPGERGGLPLSSCTLRLMTRILYGWRGILDPLQGSRGETSGTVGRREEEDEGKQRGLRMQKREQSQHVITLVTHPITGLGHQQKCWSRGLAWGQRAEEVWAHNSARDGESAHDQCA